MQEHSIMNLSSRKVSPTLARTHCTLSCASSRSFVQIHTVFHSSPQLGHVSHRNSAKNRFFSLAIFWDESRLHSTRACDVLESLEPESSGRVAKATMRMRTPVETRSWARVGVGRKIGSDARPSREFQTEKGRQWQDESVAQLSGCKHQGCRVADRFGDRSDCK